MKTNPSRLDRLRGTAARWIATLTGDTRAAALARVDQDIAATEAADATRRHLARYIDANPKAVERVLACAWACHVGRWEDEMANPLRPVPRQHRPYDQEGGR